MGCMHASYKLTRSDIEFNLSSCHSFMWNSDAIREAWPTVFQLQHEDIRFYPEDTWGPFFLPFQGLGTVSGNAMNLYYAWFVLYCLWMVVIGFELTRTKRDKDGNILRKPKYDTIYFGMVRDGYAMAVGSLWGRKREVSKKMMADGDYEYRDFALYMCIHAFLIFVSTNFLAYACLKSQTIHSAFIWILVVVCVYRGASRYTYWVTNSSSKALQKHYHDVLEDAKHAKRE